MNIKELEFIRDFCEKLENLKKGICEIAYVCQGEMPKENHDLIYLTINSLFHQTELMQELFSMFKKKLDLKHNQVWQKAYPHMQPIEE